MANPASEREVGGEPYDMECSILDTVGYGIHIFIVLVQELDLRDRSLAPFR